MRERAPASRRYRRVHRTACTKPSAFLWVNAYRGLLRAMIIKIDKTRGAVTVRKYLDRAINNRHRRGDIPYLMTICDISFIIAKRSKSAASNYYVHGKLITEESVTLLLTR